MTISGEGAEGGEERRRYDAVIVGNGHHWDPRWPEPPFPGEFDGVQMHSHDYRRPEQLEGRRVVVVGGGNSGMDIARDASFVADAHLPLAASRRARDPQAARAQATCRSTRPWRRRGCRGR